MRIALLNLKKYKKIKMERFFLLGPVENIHILKKIMFSIVFLKQNII